MERGTGAKGFWTSLQRTAFRVEVILPRGVVEASRRAAWVLKDHLMELLRPGHCRPGAPLRYFTFRGNEYPYFYHRYNQTWRNERAVEVSIAREFIRNGNGASILEVGNVLSHYFPVQHDILDKYEKAGGVINRDVVDFDPGCKYDLVVSVSTLEHVGWEGKDLDPEKGLLALWHLAGLLRPGGTMVVTLPVRKLWVNTNTIRCVAAGSFPFTELYGFVRDSGVNRWVQVEPQSALRAPTGSIFYRPVNAFLVGIYRAPQGGRETPRSSRAGLF